MSDRAPHEKKQSSGDAGTHREHDATRGETPASRGPNDALQTLYRSGAIRARLRVGSSDDPAERDADRMADAALRGGAVAPRTCGCAAGSGGCPSCRGNGTTVRRKEKASRAGGAREAGQLSLGSGRPLGDADRGFFEARMQTDFSAVRVHDDSRASDAAGRLDARAFTLGQDVVFAGGEYRPDTSQGRQLLAHELAHVAQADTGTIRREPLKKEDEKPQDPAHPTMLKPGGTLEERISNFKSLVLNTAVHRLVANQKNLMMWDTLVHNSIPQEDLSALALQQKGGDWPYFEMQDMRDPAMRDLRAYQAKGKYRACTGCHIQTQIHSTRGEREAASLEEWATPNEIRYNQAQGGYSPNTLRPLTDFGNFDTFNSVGFKKPKPTTYSPPKGSAEAELNAAFPDPGAVRESLTRIQPIIEVLGPNQYDVLTTDLLPFVLAGKSSALRCAISADITKRHDNFGTLITKVQGGDIGWEHFGPIITSLLPLADSEVQSSIKKEMDDHAFWQKVEAVVVGILSVAALILTIFPPTTALGLAMVASLDLTLAYYGWNKGQEMRAIGEMYGLGHGANDVFSKEQQESADTMVFMGWVSMIGSVLQGAGGLAKLTAASKMGPPNLAALMNTSGSAGTVSRVFQRGGFIMTIAEDGTMYVTIGSRPDLVIIARGHQATLYQIMEGGGMRVVATGTLAGDVANPAVAPLLLGSAEAGVGAGGTAGTQLMIPGTSALTLADDVGAGTQLLAPRVPSPFMLGSGEAAAGEMLMMPGASGPFQLAAPRSPFLLPGAVDEAIDVTGNFVSSERVLITPPPKVPLQLKAGNQTTYSWEDITKMKQPNLWEQREIYMQELYGSSGHQHFPVPGTGGRHADVPVPLGGGRTFAGEVKSYLRYVGTKGVKGGTKQVVDASDKILEQIRRDVWLKENLPGGYEPLWMFTDAPPSEALRQALREAGIPFVEYLF